MHVVNACTHEYHSSYTWTEGSLFYSAFYVLVLLCFFVCSLKKVVYFRHKRQANSYLNGFTIPHVSADSVLACWALGLSICACSVFRVDCCWDEVDWSLRNTGAAADASITSAGVTCRCLLPSCVLFCLHYLHLCVFFVQVCLPFTCDDLFRMHLDSQELWLNNLEQLLLLLLHPFNSFFYKTTWISRYKKGKTSLALNEARGDGVLECSGISWTIMQTICTSLQTDNHSNTSSLNFYRPDALPDA